jgi:hypothetical protein
MPWRLVLAFGAAVTVLGACGGSGGESGCRPVIQEQLDPNWVVHLLPGEESEEPEYRSDPPTSGPHFSSPPVEGVQEEPLPKPLQVTVLEAGDILAQYDPDEITGNDLAALEGLAEDPVVVAPNPDLDDPVVLTAWLQKQECGSVDAAAIEAFADEHRDNAPGVGN